MTFGLDDSIELGVFDALPPKTLHINIAFINNIKMRKVCRNSIKADCFQQAHCYNCQLRLIFAVNLPTEYRVIVYS